MSTTTISKYTSGGTRWSLLLNNCLSMTSWALNMSSSATRVLKSHFYGIRYEGNISITAFSLSIGGTVTISKHIEGYTIGIGSTISYDAIPFNIGFNLNKGVTTENISELVQGIREAF